MLVILRKPTTFGGNTPTHTHRHTHTHTDTLFIRRIYSSGVNIAAFCSWLQTLPLQIDGAVVPTSVNVGLRGDPLSEEYLSNQPSQCMGLVFAQTAEIYADMTSAWATIKTRVDEGYQGAVPARNSCGRPLNSLPWFWDYDHSLGNPLVDIGDECPPALFRGSAIRSRHVGVLPSRGEVCVCVCVVCVCVVWLVCVCVTRVYFLRVDSLSIRFNHQSFQTTISLLPLRFDGFLKRQIPGKHGHGRYPSSFCLFLREWDVLPRKSTRP